MASEKHHIEVEVADCEQSLLYEIYHSTCIRKIEEDDKVAQEQFKIAVSTKEASKK